MTTIDSSELTPNTPIKTEDAVLEIRVLEDALLPPGRHVFQLVVADDAGNISEPALAEVIIRDTQAPTAVLDVRPARQIEFGASFALLGERSSDIPPGRIVSYTWTLVSNE